MLAVDDDLRLRALTERDLAELDAFYAANPEYSLLVNGHAPHPGDAREEFFAPPPPPFTYTRCWVISIDDANGNVVGAASVVADMLAPQVWHIGLYMVATAGHGSGLAQRAYRLLESWMRAQGAQWLRLGVVTGNTRAQRFWERVGFVEVRQRHGVEIGARTHTIRVMVKPLLANDIATYLTLVARDRPD